jgi:hypothetical protein
MQNKQISGYDDTKKMLNTLRKLNESRTSYNTLREQSEMNQPEVETKQDNDEVSVINDVDIKIVSTDNMDLKITDDEKSSISGIIDSFRNEVSQIADLKPGITITESQIRLDGNLTEEDLSFVFIVGDEPGLYLNADMLKVEDETVTSIDKLVKFESTFKTTMEPMLRQRRTN